MRIVNVLHLRDTHEIGGPGKTILETHRAIDPGRFQLHLGVFLRRGEAEDSPFVAEARRLDFPLHCIRGAHAYDVHMIRQVVDLVKTLQIDILHAHEVKSDVIAYLASRFHLIPIVTTVHGWIANSLKDRLFVKMDKRVLRRFDRVIAVSRRIEEELLAAGVPGERLRMVHNAIVVERYRRTGRHGMLAEMIGRPIPSPVIASLGRLSPEKGHADLIDAVGHVVRSGKEVSLVLIGDGPERSKLVQRINAMGLHKYVYVLGYIQKPQRLFEEIDLMVLPSHTEGLPNAALEALLMEVPVLATRVGGTPEVITDGKTGRLVSAHSPDELAAGILEFLSFPESWKLMAMEGREMVRANFDFQARTRRLEAIYDELLQERA